MKKKNIEFKARLERLDKKSKEQVMEQAEVFSSMNKSELEGELTNAEKYAEVATDKLTDEMKTSGFGMYFDQDYHDQLYSEYKFWDQLIDEINRIGSEKYLDWKKD